MKNTGLFSAAAFFFSAALAFSLPDSRQVLSAVAIATVVGAASLWVTAVHVPRWRALRAAVIPGASAAAAAAGILALIGVLGFGQDQHGVLRVVGAACIAAGSAAAFWGVGAGSKRSVLTAWAAAMCGSGAFVAGASVSGAVQPVHVLAGVALAAGVSITAGPLVIWAWTRQSASSPKGRRAVLVQWGRSWWLGLSAAAAGALQLAGTGYVRGDLQRQTAFAFVLLFVSLGALAAVSGLVHSGVTRRKEPGGASAVGVVAAVSVFLVAVPSAGLSGVVADAPVPASQSAEAPVAPGVVSAASQFGEDFDACLSVADYLEQKDCYSEYFIEVADDNDIAFALDLLVEVHTDPAGVLFRNHCHEVLHDIAADQTGKLGTEEMFKHWRVTCTGGFAHGVLIVHVDEVGWENVEADIPAFCDNVTDQIVAANPDSVNGVGWLEWTCSHMIGHVIYEQYSADKDSIAVGADLCLTFDDPSSLENCGAGFFMERFLDTTREQNGYTRPTTVDEVFETCTWVSTTMRSRCFSEVGANTMAFANADVGAAYQLCFEATADSDLNREACYRSVARMVTVTSGFEYDRMVEGCEAAGAVDPAAGLACGGEVAAGLITELQAAETALKFCEDLIPDPELLEGCKLRVDQISTQLDQSGFEGSIGDQP